jgi:hypothetical protein
MRDSEILSSQLQEPDHIDVGSVFEPPGERIARRERTLSRLLDALNDWGRHDPDEVDPIGSFDPLCGTGLNVSIVHEL